MTTAAPKSRDSTGKGPNPLPINPRKARFAESINRMVLSIERTRLKIARVAYFDPRMLFD